MRHEECIRAAPDRPQNLTTECGLVSLDHGPLPRIKPDIVWTTVSDGVVLFSTERELYYGANRVAALVWEQLVEATRTFDEVCSAVAEKYPDADAGQIRDDVNELLADFEEHGLIQRDAAA